MQTKYFVVDKVKPDPEVLKEAAQLLKQGDLLAFPTETVYGLGANGLDGEAVAKIYKAKGRPSDNPLILHIAEQKDLAQLVADIPANAQALIDRYWPGPLTVVLKRSEIIPDIVSGGLDTVGVRLPGSIIARQLISLAGVPIAAPSANTSGRPSPTSAQAVLDDLAGRIDGVIDGGLCNIGVESTVVDCTTPVPTLLRPGGITAEMLIDTLGEIEIDPTLNGSADYVPRSPGMKYTHYAPIAPMILIEGPQPQAENLMLKEIQSAVEKGQKVGAIVSAQTAEKLPGAVAAAVYGQRLQTDEIAANLYTALRSFDDCPIDVIYAEGISEEGLGLAVMNRLRKASGYKIIKV